MPKKVRAASGQIVGGHGARRLPGDTTPSGRDRSAGRWTSPAAIGAQQQLLHTFNAAPPATYKTQALANASVLASDPALAQFLQGIHILLTPERDRRILSANMQTFRAKVEKTPAKTVQIAKQLWDRIKFHAGPTGRLAGESIPFVATWQAATGAWLDPVSSPFRSPRLPPWLGSRLSKQLSSWGPAAFIGKPEFTVVCGERAAGRVNAWRKNRPDRAKKSPPASLVRALLHCEKVPTALANSGDAYYLPVLRRWASPTEVLRLFGVPATAVLFKAIRDGPFYLSATAIVSCLGRAVHVDCASRALTIALGIIDLPDGDVRYASACSGLDLFAVAAMERFGNRFKYVHAAEIRPSVAKALAATYVGQGLTNKTVLADATKISPIVGPSEIWTLGPPCEPFSKRNHERSEERTLDAARKLSLMLWYPRMWRPRIILVENVEEKEAVAVISAALLSLPGYVWIEITTEARDYSDMHRARHIWIGTLQS